MDDTERQVIDELFGKIKQAQSGSGARDPQAEARIREHVTAQPAAPYYMAQAIVIQEQALAASQARIEQLESELAQRPAAGGGFLGGLFGGGGSSRPAPARRGPAASPASGVDPRLAAYNSPYQRQGGGFLSGALQTAMGVAGGMLVGNALMHMFEPAAAAAAEPSSDDVAHEAAPHDAPQDDAPYDVAPDETPDEEQDLGGFDEL